MKNVFQEGKKGCLTQKEDLLKVWNMPQVIIDCLLDYIYGITNCHIFCSLGA